MKIRVFGAALAAVALSAAFAATDAVARQCVRNNSTGTLHVKWFTADSVVVNGSNAIAVTKPPRQSKDGLTSGLSDCNESSEQLVAVISVDRCISVMTPGRKKPRNCADGSADVLPGTFSTLTSCGVDCFLKVHTSNDPRDTTALVQLSRQRGPLPPIAIVGTIPADKTLTVLGSVGSIGYAIK